MNKTNIKAVPTAMPKAKRPSTTTKTSAPKNSRWKNASSVDLITDLANGAYPYTQEIHDTRYEDTFRRLVNKFSPAMGSLSNTHPEVTFEDQVLIMCSMECLLSYPNLLSAVMRRKGNDDWKRVLGISIEGTLHSHGLPSNPSCRDVEYFREISHGIVESIDQWCISMTKSGNNTHTSVEHIPIAQRPDRELLRAFAGESRNEEIIVELERRSKGKGIVAIREDSKEFQLDLSCELVRLARKGQPTPRQVDNCLVYTIAEADIKNRVRHECPLCKNIALIRNTCPICQRDYTDVSIEDRKAIRLGLILAEERGGNTASPFINFICFDNPGLVRHSKQTPGFEQKKMMLEAMGKEINLLLVDSPVIIERLPTSDPFFNTVPKKEG